MSTCALVAASDFNAKHFKTAYDAGRFDAVFAVDAGYAHLEAVGCVPDIARGGVRVSSRRPPEDGGAAALSAPGGITS